MFEFEENLGMNAKIKVVGVGGGGGNSIKTMMKEIIDGVDFVAINTDMQALKENEAMVKIQIGSRLTKGLGSGSDPSIGKQAALEDEKLISEALSGTDMIFITAGMGGGTGTGAAPVIGKIAKDMGILTVGVVTKPFSFEGRKRQKQAEEGIAALKENVDTLICLPNDNLLTLVGKDTPIIDSFKMVDHVVLQAVRGISDLITIPGLINLDFADIKTIMSDSGVALMGSGTATGENRALNAAKLAITSPLLESVSISGATGIILNITGTSQMTLFEVNAASQLIQQECDEDVNIIFGTVIDDNSGDTLRVTVIATGFGKKLENIQSESKKDKRSFSYQDFMGINKKTTKTSLPEPKLPQRQPEISAAAIEPETIHDVFNNRLDEDLFSQKSFRVDSSLPAETETFTHEKPQSLWGEAMPSTQGRDLTPLSSGITRKRDLTEEQSDIKKLLIDYGCDDFDNEEYDIPAFIRRRAD